MPKGPAQRLTINGVEIDLAGEKLRDASGADVPLRPQAFAVLAHLLANAGRVVSKDELMSAVWPEVAVTDDSLVQCVSDIRRALRDDARRVLRTAPRRGYRLELPDPSSDSARRRRFWRAIAVATALLAAATLAFWSRDPPAPAEVSIAVLPFTDFGGDARQARFAAAFTEDLITDLARSQALRVVARGSSEAAAAETPDARAIAARLGVSHVLEGGLESPPGRIRVTAQLIDGRTGAHVWSERYDRPAEDLFAVRDAILARLVGTLTGYDGPLWRDWIAQATRRPPESLRAYDYMLLAQEPYRRHDAAGIVQARRLLETAVALDPTLAAAWDFLAHAYMQEAINGWGDRDAAWTRYRDAVRRAAELDPADGRIQISLGAMYFERGDLAAGTAAWERALALAPNDALVNRAIGTQLAMALGVERAEEGVRLVRRALDELDPLHPPFQIASLGIALYFAGEFDAAAAALGGLPDPWLEPLLFLASALAMAGDDAAARIAAAEVLRLDPGFSAEGWIVNDIYQIDGTSAQLLAKGARAAGLPICAAEAAVPMERLAECRSARRP